MATTKGLNRSTDAYQRFKTQTDDLWNFAVMICYAVPALHKTIKGVKEGVQDYSLPKNELFPHEASSLSDIMQFAQKYKPRLAAFLWLSNFSFFEAYVTGALDEVISFHGGRNGFIDNAANRARSFIAKNHSGDVLGSRSRLSGKYAPHKVDRYRKYTRALEAAGYRFPSELMAAYGIRCFVSTAGELKAKDIPSLLDEIFHLKFPPDVKTRYDKYRQIRNNIAHGEQFDHSLKAAFDVRKNLGRMATRIDEHLVANFFVMETFRQ